MNNKDKKYLLRIITILSLGILFLIIYLLDEGKFYKNISYFYFIGLLILLMLPNLNEFNLFGVKAKSENNREDLEGFEYG